MSITTDLRNLLNHKRYEENNSSEDRHFGGISVGTKSAHDHHHVYLPGALTYSEDEHGFFVEPLTSVIPFAKIKDIIIKYTGKIHENKSYSNIILKSYTNAQLDKDVNDNWDDHVFFRINSMLDMSCHMFCRLFHISLHEYDGTNMFFYPSDISEIIDDENRYKTHEKEKYFEALSLSQEVTKNLDTLSKESNPKIKELEDSILDNIFKLYDKDYFEFKSWASNKSGYGIGGHIAILETDWNSIISSWNKIKCSCPDIFTSNRFEPDAAYRKSYSTAQIKTNFVDYIDRLFSSTNIEKSWIELSNGVYASFYGKPIDA